MKKVLFFAIAAAAALTACSKSEVIDSKFDQAISFENYVGRDAMTKATPYGSTALPNSAGVYGFYTGNDVWKTTTTPNLWANLQLTIADGKGTYDSSQTKYWTNESDKYSFLAYAPFANNNGLVASTGANPTVTYTVPATLDTQLDLLYANKQADANGANGHVDMVKPANDAVNLEFKHALSRVTVKAVDSAEDEYTYKVYGVSISGNFITEGTLTLKTNEWVATDNDKATETYVFATNSETAVGQDVPAVTNDAPNGYDFAGANNYLMIIPTTFTEDAPATLTVTYTTIFDEHESTKMTKTLNIAQEFVQGTAYSLNLAFAPNTTHPISFTVSVSDWGNETNVPAGNPEEGTPVTPTQAE